MANGLLCMAVANFGVLFFRNTHSGRLVLEWLFMECLHCLEDIRINLRSSRSASVRDKLHYITTEPTTLYTTMYLLLILDY